jgi:hypothetical protein
MRCGVVVVLVVDMATREIAKVKGQRTADGLAEQRRHASELRVCRVNNEFSARIRHNLL